MALAVAFAHAFGLTITFNANSPAHAQSWTENCAPLGFALQSLGFASLAVMVASAGGLAVVVGNTARPAPP